MKACWQRAIVEFESKVMRDVSKAEFLTVWAPAYLEAFDESTTRAAFKVTGIIPFNPNFVTAEQMKPSEATSTRGEFPMPQPSPVRAITNSMRLHPPTRFDLSPSNIALSSNLASSSPPQTPSRRRSWDEMENIDPVLWSPSKKMRTLYAHLGSTSTGSLLLSSPKIKSYDTSIIAPVIQHVPRSIKAPDWTLLASDGAEEGYKSRNQLENEIAALQKQLALARQNVVVRDNIIEEANATMIFQNVGLKKMKEALHQQEEKAATDRARLFKGRAQVLSSDEFTNQVKDMNTAKKLKDAGKEAKRVARERKKELREELEKEWAQMKERHVAAVEIWSQECSELLAAKTKKKDLPPKPKLGKKPQIPVEEDDEDDLEDEVIDDGDV
ncbi:hypothetical protein B0H16DRAFT_348353, partial [Mycena metata]